MSVVRQSKFRHVFASPPKPENSYLNLKPASSAWDSNFVKGGNKFFAIAWQTGGGALAVIDYSDTGKSHKAAPQIAGHSGAILDFDWSPFNDHILASASEDSSVKVWVVPEEGYKDTIVTEPAVCLSDHSKKVGTCDFNPTAESILATSGFDCSIKIWDIEKGMSICSQEIATKEYQCVSWNYDGSTLAAFSKDKFLRVLDPRSKAPAQEIIGHEGPKGGRCLWLGSKGKILTTGFSKSADRQYALWDPVKLSQPLTIMSVDQASGMLMPFYDDDTCILFIAGKGDGNIRLYEVDDSAAAIHYLNDFKSQTPQRGCCLLSKRVCDVAKNEVCRLLKLTTTTVEPMQFVVPRKADSFQEDLYPDCFSGVPTVTADEWTAGKHGPPLKSHFRPEASLERTGSEGRKSLDPGMSNIRALSPMRMRPNEDSEATARVIKEMQEHMARMKDDYEGRLRSKEAEAQASVKAKAALERDKSELQAMVAKLQSDLARETDKQVKLPGHGQEDTVAQLNAQVRDLTARLEAESSHKRGDAVASELQAELARLRTRDTQLTSQVASLQAELADLRRTQSPALPKSASDQAEQLKGKATTLRPVLPKAGSDGVATSTGPATPVGIHRMVKDSEHSKRLKQLQQDIEGKDKQIKLLLDRLATGAD